MDYPKFILTGTGHFRLGMVHMHKDLLQAGEECYGGGFYEFDYVSNRLILTGRSFDFGKPKWHCFDTLMVSAAYRGLKLVYIPDSSLEENFIVSEEIAIEYVD